MLITTENIEYKELSVLNKGGENTSPPTTSESRVNLKKQDNSDNSRVKEYIDTVEIFSNKTKSGVETKRKADSNIPKEEEHRLKNEKLMEDKLLEKLNNIENTELRFEQDKITKRNLIKILDKKTKKVVRQIPPEEFYKFIVELYKLNQKNDKVNNNKEYNVKSENLKGIFINENT